MAWPGNKDTQNIIIHSPNQPLIRSKELDDYVYTTFKHLQKSHEYNEIGWLILSQKEKDEFMNSNPQLKCHVSDLKSSPCALKETFFSCGHRAEITGHQAPNPVLWLVESQPRLISQPHRLCTVHVRTLTGKKWAPEGWTRDTWEDPDKPGDIEPLNSDESSLALEKASPPSVGVASPQPFEEINPALPKETVMASYEAVAVQDNIEFPQETPWGSPL